MSFMKGDHVRFVGGGINHGIRGVVLRPLAIYDDRMVDVLYEQIGRRSTWISHLEHISPLEQLAKAATERTEP